MSQRFMQSAKDSVAALMLLVALGAVFALDRPPPAIHAASSQGALEPAGTEPGDSALSSESNEAKEGEIVLGGLAAEFTLSGPPDAARLPAATPIVVPGIEPPKPKLTNKKPEPRLFANVTPPPKTIRGPAPPPPPVPRKPLQVEFFGIRSEAETVGFVVDCSDSMKGEKFERLRFELAKAIVDLQPEQSFYVVFFNNNFFPQIGIGKRQHLVSATAALKTETLGWLARAYPTAGTNPEPAIAFISQFPIERLYFMTDGQFPPISQGTMAGLINRSIKVNSVAFGQDSDIRNLQFIASQTGGDYGEAPADSGLPNLYYEPLPTLRNALRNSSPDIRRLAREIVFGLDLPLVSEIVDALREPDQNIRDYVHEELVRVATGTDFGPFDDTSSEIEAAIARWHQWTKLRNLSSPSVIAGRLASANTDERWTGAAIARQHGLNLPDELIKIVRDANPQIRREVRAALVQLAKGPDFGPDPIANQAEIDAAAMSWAKWRSDALVAIASAKLAEQERHAATMLKTAKTFLSKAGPENTFEHAAQVKLAELVRKYPDTKAAAEARTLLKP